MLAIILNSGIGKRMGTLTQSKPKCLVKLTQTETILSRQMQMLINHGIGKAIITTGPFEEQVKEHIRINFPKTDVVFINNPLYASTNYIYSLFLIPRELIHEDVILMHGDLVFDEGVLIKLLGSQNPNAALVNSKAPLPEKDFKCRIVEDTIREISVNIFGPDCFPLLPLYRLSKESFLMWMDEIRRFINEGATNVYAEDAFNTISDTLQLSPLYVDRQFCMEIDNLADLERAREFFTKKNQI